MGLHINSTFGHIYIWIVYNVYIELSQLEEQQERQKLSREKEIMKRRSLDSFQKDIHQRQREFEKRVSKHLISLMHFNNEYHSKGEVCQIFSFTQLYPSQ